jgi:CheY-like chemotaxis protein
VSSEIRILLAEDSEAGRAQWEALESHLRESLAPCELARTEALNGSDLLLKHRSLCRQGRQPDLIVLDLHLPAAAPVTTRKPGSHPSTIKAGVWLAIHLRRAGNETSKIVLWSNNILANEVNDAFAFSTIEINGLPLGDAVLDKASDTSEQARSLIDLLDRERGSAPAFVPPAASTKLGDALVRTLPFLEAGLRPSAIAEIEHVTKDTIDSRIQRLKDELCHGLDTTAILDLRTAIVSAARQAGITWVPFSYSQPESDPFG